MRNYKAPDNSLHSLSEEDIENGGLDMLPAGSVEITDQEAKQLSAPSPEQAKADRIIAIDAELAALDDKGRRPSREIAVALAAGQPAPAAAVQKLADIEAQAGPLRAERKTLTT